MSSTLTTQPLHPLPRQATVQRPRGGAERRTAATCSPGLSCSWAQCGMGRGSLGAQPWSGKNRAAPGSGQLTCSARAGDMGKAGAVSGPSGFTSWSRTGLGGSSSRPGSPTFAETVGTTQSPCDRLFSAWLTQAACASARGRTLI